MIELFLAKPIWDSDENAGLAESRITLFNELENIIWTIITSEGRSEARLWLCEGISRLRPIGSHEQCELFMTLLKSKPLNHDIAVQVLQMIIERKPQKLGLILAKKSRRLEKFFERHPHRILQWFSTFSLEGESAHGKGAKALSQFAFVNRDICWEELEWIGKHGQSPAVVATKPHYFLDLDVQQTIENFLENIPEFWSSKEFAESLKDGEILSIDKNFFVEFFVNLMYKDNLKDIWDAIAEFFMDESFSYLCQRLLILLDERDLCDLLKMLHNHLTRRFGVGELVNFSYFLEIVICKCGDQVSIDQLFLLNALFNKGRQLLRHVNSDENHEEKLKLENIVLKIWTNLNDAKSLVPITEDCFKSKMLELEIMKWLGLLSWSILYRLSKECHTSESWKAVFIGNKIDFRRSVAYGALEHDGSSGSSELENRDKKMRKIKKKRKRKRKIKLDYDNLGDEDMLDLGGSDDKFTPEVNSRSWLLCTDEYSTSWSLVDLPEHLSKHCLREWMKQIFKH